jgi:hypothetical protein
MRTRRWANRLNAAVVAAAAAIAPASVTLTACYADTGFVAVGIPPAPYYETYAYRPGFVWVNGWWAPSGGRWAWQRGHYVRARPGYWYAQPHWVNSGGRYNFHRGGWHRYG